MIKVGDRLTIDGKLVEVTYVMNDLKEAGVDVDSSATTVEEAKEEILCCVK
jgi:energy-coupling factor transport system ATP-binding protein